MPSKSFDGVGERLRNRAEKCDLRIQKLQQYAGNISAAEIAVILKCTERAVKCLAQRNGISLRVQGRVWTVEEEVFVRQNAQKLTMAELARQLERSEFSIKSFCQRKNITLFKTGENHHNAIISDADVELCRRLHEERVPVKLIARKMEIKVNHVRNIIYYRRS